MFEWFYERLFGAQPVGETAAGAKPQQTKAAAPKTLPKTSAGQKKKTTKTPPRKPTTLDAKKSLPVKAVTVVKKRTDQKPTRTAKKDAQSLHWEEMFMKLTSFKEAFGHTEVANNFDDKELAQWVRKQRQTWKRRSEGKVTRMSNDQVDKLDSLGFSWTVSRGRKPIETKKSKKSSKPSRK